MTKFEEKMTDSSARLSKEDLEHIYQRFEANVAGDYKAYFHRNLPIHTRVPTRIQDKIVRSMIIYIAQLIANKDSKASAQKIKTT